MKNIKTILIKNSVSEGFGELLKLGITSILVEGGPSLISSLICEKAFDKITVYVAPKVLGEGLSYFKKTQMLMINRVIV